MEPHGRNKFILGKSDHSVFLGSLLTSFWVCHIQNNFLHKLHGNVWCYQNLPSCPFNYNFLLEDPLIAYIYFKIRCLAVEVCLWPSLQWKPFASVTGFISWRVYEFHNLQNKIMYCEHSLRGPEQVLLISLSVSLSPVSSFHAPSYSSSCFRTPAVERVRFAVSFCFPLLWIRGCWQRRAAVEVV